MQTCAWCATVWKTSLCILHNSCVFKKTCQNASVMLCLSVFGIQCFFQDLGECFCFYFPAHPPRGSHSQQSFSPQICYLVSQASLLWPEFIWHVKKHLKLTVFFLSQCFSWAFSSTLNIFNINFLFVPVLLPTAGNSYFCSRRPPLDKLEITGFVTLRGTP